MAKPVAVADSSFLAYAAKMRSVNLFKRLYLLFDYILFPQKVLSEFTPRKDLPENVVRNQIIAQVRSTEEGFFRLCTRIDPSIYNFVKTIDNVDDGEAEAIAQSKTRLINYILIDDYKSRKNLPQDYHYLRYLNSITIVALLDLNGWIDYQECLKELYQIRKFNSKDLRSAYKSALEHYGLRLTSKALSAKTSLSKLGINP